VTKYLYDVPFSSKAATDEYRANWDAIFGRKATEIERAKEAESELLFGSIDRPHKPCPCESGGSFGECHGAVGDDPADA
jgi:hypothetical protein